jgi:hypothetical protein
MLPKDKNFFLKKGKDQNIAKWAEYINGFILENIYMPLHM